MKLTIYREQKQNTTYLQGVAGWVAGTPAGELKAGDTLVWNFGSTSKVVGIEKETKAFVWVVSEYMNSRNQLEQGTRKMKKDRIVARPAEELA